mgnify:CR=1 FL=1
MEVRDWARILVTGGAGFIGSAFVRYLYELGAREVIVLDKLTYAGNLANLADLRQMPGFRFVRGDIGDPVVVAEAMDGCDAVVNFAAETHVDRSLLEPAAFIQTNVHGTHVLLETALRCGVKRFVQVSTDEVYGEVLTGWARETDPLRPRNPYSASKAAGDLLTLAYHTSYGLPALVTRGSNTYGPYQYPEKFIPLAVTNVLDGLPIPVYGDGRQERDWLHVRDHCRAIALVLNRGEPGQIYNIGARHHRPNLEVARAIARLLGADEALIQHVSDRPGHDRRYAVDTAKITALGWAPEIPFETGLAETVNWYRAHRDWWEPLKSGQFADYYHRNYGRRTVLGPVCGR